MSHRHAIWASLIIVVLALTGFSNSFQAADDDGGIPWWIWLLLIIILIVLFVWWWRQRSEAEARSTAPYEQAAPPPVTERPAPTPEPTEPPASSPELAEPDDLTRVEGIGPKISHVLQAAGIATFAQLADADVDRLRQIIQEAGLRLADPGTWPEQASLAAAGRWEELQKLQDELEGGRRRPGT